jgi:excisionase family DNA binding protein
MVDSSDQLLTVREIAERVKVNDVTVQRWLRSGRLKGMRPGGRRTGWRIAESELRRFLAESTHTVGEPEGATR